MSTLTPTSPEPKFELVKHLIALMTESPFYSYLSSHITKVQTLQVPTAMVAYCLETEEITMYVNPRYAAKQSDSQVRGLLTHEFDHVVFGHLACTPSEPQEVDGIAKDLAINSLIKHNAQRPRDLKPEDPWYPLPLGGVIPGERTVLDPARLEKLKQEDPARLELINKFSDILEGLPPLKASAWYFQRLLSDMAERGIDPGDVKTIFQGPAGPGPADPGPAGPGPADPGPADPGPAGPTAGIDVHRGWGARTPEEREYVESRVRALVSRAVQHADGRANGWGNIPAEIREEIRRSVSHIVDWRNVLRQFVGTLVRGHRRTSFKRINRRYPCIHPGLTKAHLAKLVVAIDQSLSVDNEMLEMFFGELEQATRHVDVTILPFDCECAESDIIEWKRGTRPDLRRVRAGGTNFSAPTAFVNHPKNRGRWDGFLIMTDGQAPAPIPSRIRRGWILGKGCKLDFPSQEIQVHLSNERQMTGAWR